MLLYYATSRLLDAVLHTGWQLSSCEDRIWLSGQGFMPTATKGSSTGLRKGSTPSKCSLLFVASSSSLSKLTLAASIVVLTVWASSFWTHDLPLYTPEPYLSAVQMQTSWAHCDRHLDSEFAYRAWVIIQTWGIVRYQQGVQQLPPHAAMEP